MAPMLYWYLVCISLATWRHMMESCMVHGFT
jgi:hypothetical protein